MKLGDFSVLDELQDQDSFQDVVNRFNETATDYPSASTVNEIFQHRVDESPDAIAVKDPDRFYTYAELDRRSNKLSHYLLSRTIAPESFVAIMMDGSCDATVAILGVLKAGAAYFSMSADLPIERAKYMLDDCAAPVLISSRGHIKKMNRLQWECAALEEILCIDSDCIHAESEEDTEMMNPEIWRFIADQAFDDISGGGWKSIYTGEWISREVMDAYGDSIETKLTPFFTKDTRVLEIGCASGISMFRLAPKCGFYMGTDLSPGIIDWCAQKAEQTKQNNIHLECLAAHEIDQLEQGDFDVVIINSVVELFSGHNYLRDVVNKIVRKMAPKGVLFLGTLWDQDSKGKFAQSLVDFKRQHGSSAHTKIDLDDDLFISRDYVEDLTLDIDELVSVEFSRMAGDSLHELSAYSFDALLCVDKVNRANTADRKRHKKQTDWTEIKRFSPERLAPIGDGNSLAYLIYTSGTTGKPKGVLVEHHSVSRLVINTNYFSLDSSDRVLKTSSMSFDASTLEIWGPLLNGASVCYGAEKDILDLKRLYSLVKDEEITCMFFTTSLLNVVARLAPEIFGHLRTLITGGEKASVETLTQLKSLFPDLRVINGYGPTENTTFTTFFEVTDSQAMTVPIGKPISNSTAYVLDDSERPLPIGVVGELYAGGDGVARGYLNAPDSTAASFVYCEFLKDQRLYRTGDRARWLEDGNLEFLGRIDDQVKVRGFRIEPADIEKNISEHPDVQEVVVITRQVDEGLELLAYVTGQDNLSIVDVKHFVSHKLPNYMVPSHIIKLAQFPLNRNGKVDIKQLPAPENFRAGHSSDAKLVLEAEKQMAGIWQEILSDSAEQQKPIQGEVLAQTQFGANDNFFDLGGHSLRATKLLAMIYKGMGVSLPLSAVFEAKTLRELTGKVLDSLEFGEEYADSPMVQLNQADGPNLFAFPPGTGDVLGYIPLAEKLENCRLFAFNFIENENRDTLYADLIEEKQPQGEITLFGYSAGGNLACHVANALELRGRLVKDIIMVDSSRKMAAYQFDPNETKRITEDFLNHETIKPYVSSPLLKDKVVRKISSYYNYIEETVDLLLLNANLHVILAEAGQDKFHDNEGKLIMHLSAWAQATNGCYRTYQGTGLHNDMLYQKPLEANAEIISRIVKESSL